MKAEELSAVGGLCAFKLLNNYQAPLLFQVPSLKLIKTEIQRYKLRPPTVYILFNYHVAHSLPSAHYATFQPQLQLLTISPQSVLFVGIKGKESIGGRKRRHGGGWGGREREGGSWGTEGGTEGGAGGGRGAWRGWRTTI